MLVTGGDDKHVCVWDTTTGDLVHMLEGHAGEVNAVGYSPDGSMIDSGL